jgi:two-component system cell cycle sensor histidine kinase/response regulator CckA
MNRRRLSRLRPRQHHHPERKIVLKTIPKLLVLEDDTRDLDLLRTRLEDEAFQCEMVVTRKQDEFEAAVKQSSFDAIISDYNLPGYDGLSALRFAHRKRPDVPFIFLSGTLGEERAIESLHQGAVDYILKNKPARLVPAIRRALEQAAERQERVKAEQALLESEERFRQLAEQSNDGFWFMALNPQRFIYVSPAMARIWGFSEETFYQDPQAWLGAVHPEDRTRVQVAFEAWVSGSDARLLQEYRVVRPDGSMRWVEASGTLIHDQAGKAIRASGIDRDITEQKQAEERFLRTQRLESIGTLASGVAHDLNNILVPILMAAPLLREEMAEDEREKLLTLVESSAERGASVVRQVLTFARGTDGNRLLIQPIYLLEEVMKIAQTTFPKSIAIRANYSDNVRTIEADPTQLHQVLLNLCVNARDAIPEGGTLVLSAENFDIDDHYASMTPEANAGPYVLLEVTDTGTGIPRELIDKIFDPFFTTKEIGKGTGLGLSTVVGIVKSHGGFVNVASEPGRTTFKIFLPAIGERDSSLRTATGELVPRGNGETILVVDDEPFFREVAETVLSKHGYKTLLAEDGIEALALFARQSKKIALVVADIVMPFMDGLTLVRTLRRMEPAVRIIISTGRDEDCHKAEIMALHLNGCLSKPYTGATLVKKLSEVLKSTHA